MSENVNTKEYWDGRFGSGDWEQKAGFDQTRSFAESQVPLLGLDAGFRGSLCDFGCGAGDAFPVYRAALPEARLFGVDFSEDAIALARRRFGDMADFRCGGVPETPSVDVIVASNAMEHVSNDEEIVEQLLGRCSVLHVVVPYREKIGSFAEHVRSYDDRSFARLAPTAVRVFPSRGWSQYGWELWRDVYWKNVLRTLTFRPRRQRNLQVMFTFRGARPPAGP